MKSKKIPFGFFIFLLQLHGASAGKSDKKVDIKEDSVEKSEELSQQSPKVQKKITLQDLLDSAKAREDALKAEEAQKLDLPAEESQSQEYSASNSQSHVYNWYEEGNEDEMIGPDHVVNSFYGEEGEEEESRSFHSQSGVARGQGEDEESDSFYSQSGVARVLKRIKSEAAQKNNRFLDIPVTHSVISQGGAALTPDSSEEKEALSLRKQQSSHQSIDKEDRNQAPGGKDSCTKQSKLSAQQESDHEGKQLDHKNHQHSHEEEKDDSNDVVKKTSRKKQPRQ